MDCPPFRTKKHTDNYDVRQYDAGRLGHSKTAWLLQTPLIERCYLQPIALWQYLACMNITAQGSGWSPT